MRFFLWGLLSVQLSAGVVRNLSMDGSKAGAIHLCLGRSTVLRFREKPKKIVAGNKNYFDFAFINNDVTIQPLRAIPSNLFVYGEYHSYAFNLKFLKGCRYDDLVKVSPTAKKRSIRRIDFVLANTLKVAVTTPVTAIGNVWMIDLSFFNLGTRPVPMNDVRVKLDRGVQQWVWGQDSLERGESSRGRVIFKTQEKGQLTLTIEWGKSRHQVIVPWGDR